MTIPDCATVVATAGQSASSEGAGLLSHFVTMADGALRVVDVWESQERFESAEEQIGPLTAEVGIPGPPKMQFFEAHNYFTRNPVGGG